MSNSHLPLGWALDIVRAAAGARAVVTTTTILDEDAPAEHGDAAFHLAVMSSEALATIPLPTRGTLVVGRSSRADVKIEDPLASREHVRLHIADGFRVEDLGSANGTCVRDRQIAPREPIAIEPGEGVTVGNTVLMVQHSRMGLVHRRIWSHAYFERRIDAECDRCSGSGGRFAVVRLRIDVPVSWDRIAPAMERTVPDRNVLAAYGPQDYELLFVEASEQTVATEVASIRRALESVGAPARAAVAWYPRDGRTADALVSAANAQLRPPRPPTIELAAVEDAVSQDNAMERVGQLAARAATSNINVLIVGECGVGKEVLARRVHELSNRRDKPMLTLNCGAIPDSMIEAELFGHDKGAFTDAGSKPGLFEAAGGGTVFLDEIGEMPMQMQVKLLRALENRVVRRLGSVRDIKIEARFIAATNRDVEADVLAGRFRQDLFFRVNGITLAIPPLRQRRSEIEPLARTFLAQACRDAGRELLTLGDHVLALLRSYSWPGNVRELKNMIERAVALCDGPEIAPEHLMLEKIALAPLDAAPSAPVPDRQTVDPSRDDERAVLIRALEQNGFNQTRAARALGMPRRTFIYRLDKYPDIPRPRADK